MTLNIQLIMGVAALVVLFVLVSLAQEVNRRMQVQREIARLDQEVAEHRRTVLELQNLNTYFQTDDYQERLAREKLNYAAPGEKIVIVPDEATASTDAATDEAIPSARSLPYLWWEHFFVDPS